MKIKCFLFITCFVLPVLAVSATEYHVSIKGNDSNDGSSAHPFRTINHAAQIAVAGDTITVHAGTYREWINPKNGGENDNRRIVYRVAVGEKAEIKGSEIITGWKKEKNGVWKIILPNSFFGSRNTCAELVYGDWCENSNKIHTADIFLNGKSLYETNSIEKVYNPEPDNRAVDKEGSKYTWYCTVDEKNTTIWANFQKQNPNKALTEISVRPTCFYPDQPGVNYLTIQGFEFSQAASQWAAPTAEQIGMISTHWNKGWIIEKNIIHDAKCTGITLGKERNTGHNVWSEDPSYDGSLHYIEVTFRTLRNGWNKENIGSHIVRDNEIYNCEQTGICGSMGAAFSLIENNHIHHIHQKKQFTGAELAGIKIHAGIDLIIRKNRIHDSGAFGSWLDWMTQGTRITQNLYYNNSWQDLFFEVNHGPYLVDNNLLLSPKSITTQSEGGAFIHNLIAGRITVYADHTRFTPYHLPHSTCVAGLSTVVAGDDRFYNNVFIGDGGKTKLEHNEGYGLSVFNLSGKKVDNLSNNHLNLTNRWPVYVEGNVYFFGALPYQIEEKVFTKADYNPQVKVVEEGENIYLQFSLQQIDVEFKTQLITTELLGKTKMPKQSFENPDGSPITFDTDYFGNKRTDVNPLPGPFANLNTNTQRLKVW